MKVLKKIVIGVHEYAVVQISHFDSHHWEQFWSKRDLIWTCKYGEVLDADGHERDLYDCDRQASYLVLVQGTASFGKVLAGTRVIHADPNLGTKLPLEEFAGHVIEGRSAEVSRFFFERGEAMETEAEELFKFFVYGLVVYLKGCRYERAYATIRASLFRKLQSLGIPLERLPQVAPGVHANKQFIPAMMFESPEMSAVEATPSTSSLVPA